MLRSGACTDLRSTLSSRLSRSSLRRCFSPTFREGLPCTEDGRCPSGQFCTVANECRSSEPDIDGGGDVPLDCEPSQVSCVGETLTECNEAGTGAVQTTCPAGCNEAEPRCNRVRLSNGLESYLAERPARVILAWVLVPRSTRPQVLCWLRMAVRSPFLLSSILSRTIRCLPSSWLPR